MFRKIIDEINNIATLDRYNLHIHGKNAKKSIRKTSQAIDTVAHLANHLSPEHFDICYQIALYHIFYSRNAEKAQKYSQLYFDSVLKTKPDHLTYSKAHNLLGASKIMNENHQDPSLFKAALASLRMYESSGNNANLISVKCIKAQSLRYLGLMFYRQDQLFPAKMYLLEAIRLLEPYKETDSYVQLDLAESYHFLGNIEVKNGDFLHAYLNLHTAYELQKEFCAETGTSHFYSLLLLQALGEVMIEVNHYDEALTLLKQTYLGQIDQYKTDKHIESGNTLQATGIAYLKINKPLKAKHAFESALSIKKQCYPEQHPSCLQTQNSLLEAIKRVNGGIERGEHLHEMGLAYLKTNNLLKAKQSFESALSIKKQCYPKQDLLLKQTEDYLSETNRKIEDHLKRRDNLQEMGITGLIKKAGFFNSSPRVSLEKTPEPPTCILF